MSIPNVLYNSGGHTQILGLQAQRIGQTHMEDKVILEIKTPKEGEETPEAMMGFLSSLVTVNSPLSFLNINPPPISLEITSIEQTIRFYLVIPAMYQPFIESQIVSQYPKAQIAPVDRLIFDKAFSQTSLLTPGFMKLASMGFNIL